MIQSLSATQQSPRPNRFHARVRAGRVRQRALGRTPNAQAFFQGAGSCGTTRHNIVLLGAGHHQPNLTGALATGGKAI